MPKKNLALLSCVVVAFVIVGVISHQNHPEQFDLVQFIVFGTIILVVGSMGLKAPDIDFSNGGISRVFKVLFGSIVIAFLSWLLIGVVTQPIIGNIVFEMVSGSYFLLSMLLLTLALYPVINKYLI